MNTYYPFIQSKQDKDEEKERNLALQKENSLIIGKLLLDGYMELQSDFFGMSRYFCKENKYFLELEGTNLVVPCYDTIKHLKKINDIQ